jgi:DNA invertase Pin-like site-specific DNA recombinase
METGVDFEAVDFPQANRLTIDILAAVAEHEAKMISERARRARSIKLGGDRGARLTAKARTRADARATDLPCLLGSDGPPAQRPCASSRRR